MDFSLYLPRIEAMTARLSDTDALYEGFAKQDAAMAERRAAMVAARFGFLPTDNIDTDSAETIKTAFHQKSKVLENQEMEEMQRMVSCQGRYMLYTDFEFQKMSKGKGKEEAGVTYQIAAHHYKLLLEALAENFETAPFLPEKIKELDDRMTDTHEATMAINLRRMTPQGYARFFEQMAYDYIGTKLDSALTALDASGLEMEFGELVIPHYALLAPDREIPIPIYHALLADHLFGKISHATHQLDHARDMMALAQRKLTPKPDGDMRRDRRKTFN